MLKGSYNFARFGLDDISVYALWTHGWDAVLLTPKPTCSSRMNMTSMCSGDPRNVSYRASGSVPALPMWIHATITRPVSLSTRYAS